MYAFTHFGDGILRVWNDWSILLPLQPLNLTSFLLREGSGITKVLHSGNWFNIATEKGYLSMIYHDLPIKPGDFPMTNSYVFFQVASSHSTSCCESVPFRSSKCITWIRIRRGLSDGSRAWSGLTMGLGMECLAGLWDVKCICMCIS